MKELAKKEENWTIKIQKERRKHKNRQLDKIQNKKTMEKKIKTNVFKTVDEIKKMK